MGANFEIKYSKELGQLQERFCPNVDCFAQNPELDPPWEIGYKETGPAMDLASSKSIYEKSAAKRR